ncbi:MAG: intermembrane transport protein PqiB [Salinisphaera sp.]|jgi:paraquat-inducible protein B|nr:intermembrane transport protein PqiB [Salinisphaera sp.]
MSQTDNNPAEDSPDRGPGDNAQIKSPRRWSISPVWLIPLVALLVGGWLLYQNFHSQGPTVTLEMDTAEGIKAGDTQLKVRSVDVGHVTRVGLTDDYQGAVVTVQMDPDTDHLLGDDTKFWVVKPRVGPQGISGLNTILSGVYLQLQPASHASEKRHFKVLDNPPVTRNGQSGVTIKLTSHGDNTLSVGDPIVYLGQNVGRIESSTFSFNKREMIYRVFVKAPYSKLLSHSTQFWLRSGVDFHLGSDGVDVQLGSIQSVLAGGVTFGLPDGVAAGKPVNDGESFTLYKTRNAATQDRYDDKIQYIVLLDDSVRGLSPGAPVEYRGLRVGTVEEVPFYRPGFQLQSFSNFKIPVLISIEPQRPSLAWADWNSNQWRQHNQQFFDHGMRASIKSSNLLTGAMFIDINFDKNAPKFTQREVGKYQVFPSEPSQITNIQQSISNLMDKLNKLNLTPIADQLKNAVATSSDTLDQLQKVTTSLNQLLNKPGTQNLPGQLNKTLKELQKTLQNFQQGAPAYQNLNQSLDRLNRVLDNVAPLTRTLRDHPDSLLFGRPNSADPVPRAKP